MEISKSLRHKLERFCGISVESTPRGSTNGSCALTVACTSCQGKGFSLVSAGAYVGAALCSCVRSCTTCQGLAQRDVAGRLEACKTPGPALLAGLINQARLPWRYRDAALEKFGSMQANGKEVLQQVLGWVQGFSSDTSVGMCFSGDVGVGKTFLLVALAKHLCERGISVRFTDFFQLLTELKSAYSDGKADPSVLGPLSEVDVLIIDELGKGRCSDWELSIADTLVSERYNRRKIIIASTNYPLRGTSTPLYANRDLDGEWLGGAAKTEFTDLKQSLETRVGKRIFSRLKEMTRFIEVEGPDLRRVSEHAGQPLW